MKTSLLSLLLCALLPAFARGQGPLDLGPVVAEPGFWTSRQADALGKFPKDTFVFFPTSQATLARAAKDNLPARFQGLSLYNPSMDLASNAVRRVSASLLKSGKQGMLLNEDADNFVKATLAELDAWAGTKGARVSGQSRSKDTKVQHHVWARAGIGVVFTYALQEVKGTQKGEKDAEKITMAGLSLLPVPAKPGPVDARALLVRERGLSVARPVPPVKNKEGDVIIASLVPGYFPASATPAAIAVERIMRTSGIDLDAADLLRLDYPADFPWQRAADGPSTWRGTRPRR